MRLGNNTNYPVSQTEKFLLQESEYRTPIHWNQKRIYRKRRLTRNRVAFELAAPLSGKLALDLGCGDGRFLHDLAKLVDCAIGIDASLLALRYAHDLSDSMGVVAADAVALPFPGESFDIVFAMDMIEHLGDEAEAKALDQVHRLLRVGGQLIVSVPSVCLPLEAKHFRHYSANELQSKMSAAAFQNVTVRGCNSYVPRLFRVIANFPIIWRFMGFMVGEVSTDRCITLVARGSKLTARQT